MRMAHEKTLASFEIRKLSVALGARPQLCLRNVFDDWVRCELAPEFCQLTNFVGQS